MNANGDNNIVDVTLSSFADDVIRASTRQLVMVDFWADWCGPCRSLSPILERLVEHYRGALRLAKVNTDQQQDLAAQFGIRSLPTVFFFKNGKPVDQFMGAQPESVIREIVGRHLDDGMSGEVGIEMIRQLYEQGETDEAKHLLRQLVAQSPEDDSPRLLLIQWLTSEGMIEEAKTISELLSDKGKESKEYAALLSALEIQESLGTIPPAEELEARLAKDGNDHSARYLLAQRLVAEHRHVDAMEHLLEIIRKDRAFEDDGARKYMVRIFSLLGGKGEVVNRYRAELARILN